MNRCSEFDAITAYKKDNLKITDLYIKNNGNKLLSSPPSPSQLSRPMHTSSINTWGC